MKRCYYETLGVSRQATEAEIKGAYRKMALQFHPDRNAHDEAEEKFKEASEAYEVLSDAQKRVIYDQFGHAGLEGRGFHPFTDVGDIFSHFSDIFEDFFGFGSTRSASRASQRGRDLRYDLGLSFEESYRGCEKKIEIQKQVSCEACGGLGYPKGHEPVTCRDCGGRGQLLHSQGFFTISTACSACAGQGKVVREHCKLCRGQGVTSKSKKINVKIPAGVDTGMQLCVRGEGEEGRGGSSGDLYVVMEVEPHPRLHRQGVDLILEKPISIVQAALGEDIQIEGPDGPERIAVPPGSQTGDILRLNHKGMPHVREKKNGDLLVHLFVETPKGLSERQKELLRAFERELEPGKKEPESSFTKAKKDSKKKPKWF